MIGANGRRGIAALSGVAGCGATSRRGYVADAGNDGCGVAIKRTGEPERFAAGAIRDSSAGKPRYTLIPPGPLRRVAAHYTAGADEYGAYNWVQGQPVSRLLDSAFRHLEAFRDGETDEDHAAACVWNLLGAMFFEGSGWDDRFVWDVPPHPGY